MEELLVFADDELPSALKCQILTAHRIEWPGNYAGEHRLRDWIQRPWFRPVHLVLAEGGILMAYAGVARKLLEHAGETYEAYGLSGVYTYPAFRRQGHGRRVVDAATARIRASDADIGLFVCVPELASFYAVSGWELMERAELFLGPRGEAWREEEDGVMMGFFSEKGRRDRHRFDTAPIYFDDDIW
jgi:GNAT superfamily N-acetyltransferase